MVEIKKTIYEAGVLKVFVGTKKKISQNHLTTDVATAFKCLQYEYNAYTDEI